MARRPPRVSRRLPVPARSTVAEEVLLPPEDTLLDLLDRLLNKGVMLNGDVALGVAGVDLIYLRLSTLFCAADRVLPRNPSAPDPKSRKSRHRQPGGPRSQ